MLNHTCPGSEGSMLDAKDVWYFSSIAEAHERSRQFAARQEEQSMLTSNQRPLTHERSTAKLGIAHARRCPFGQR